MGINVRAFAEFCKTDALKYESIPKTIRILIVRGEEDAPFTKEASENVAGKIHGSNFEGSCPGDCWAVSLALMHTTPQSEILLVTAFRP